MGCPPGVLDQRLLRDNVMVLLEGTSWKHQAHAAGGACFQKEGHCIVKLVSFIRRSGSMELASVTPQGDGQIR